MTDSSTIFFSSQKNGLNNVGLCPLTLPSKTWDDIKNIIDTAVQNNYIVSIFTHLVSENPSSIDTSTTIFNQVVTYIKSLVDNQQAEVLTVRDFYAKYHAQDENYREHARLMSMIADKY